jgi:hypothetical protein
MVYRPGNFLLGLRIKPKKNCEYPKGSWEIDRLMTYTNTALESWRIEMRGTGGLNIYSISSATSGNGGEKLPPPYEACTLAVIRQETDDIDV